MAGFRVVFSRVLLGVPFPVALIDVRRARDVNRAVRAAELRLIRRMGLEDWRERADTRRGRRGPRGLASGAGVFVTQKRSPIRRLRLRARQRSS